MKQSFVFYRSYHEALIGLDGEIVLEVFNAICEYSLNDVEPELKGVSKSIFTLIKPQIEANKKRYENGLKGGRKKQDETKKEPKRNQNVTKTEPNVNDNVNVNVNEYSLPNKVNNIEERKLKFSETLIPFVELYGKQMIDEFYSYWVEPNKSNTKFRMELEKTWELSRRLQTWAKNQKINFTSNGKVKQSAGEQLNDHKQRFFAKIDAEVNKQRDQY